MFKVGDIVEITAEADATGMLDFEKGKGYPIIEVGCLTTNLTEPVKVYYLKIKVMNESGVEGWYTASHFKLKEEAKVEKKECLFKVGQVVWDLIYGKGVVTELGYNPQYPVRVTFDNGGYEDYTHDGRKYEDDKVRSLYFSEPKIEAATEPVFEPVLKKGDMVMVFSKDTHTAMTVGIVEQETEDRVDFGIGNGSYRKSGFVFYRTGEKIEFN